VNEKKGIVVGDYVVWVEKTYGRTVVGLVLGVEPNTFYPGVDTYSILDSSGVNCRIHSSVWKDYRILNR